MQQYESDVIPISLCLVSVLCVKIVKSLYLNHWGIETCTQAFYEITNSIYRVWQIFDKFVHKIKTCQLTWPTFFKKNTKAKNNFII